MTYHVVPPSLSLEPTSLPLPAASAGLIHVLPYPTSELDAGKVAGKWLRGKGTFLKAAPTYRIWLLGGGRRGEAAGLVGTQIRAEDELGQVRQQVGQGAGIGEDAAAELTDDAAEQ